MSDDQKRKGGGAAAWFLKRLVSLPSTWIGLAAGIAVGNAAYGVNMPMGGAVASGVMISLFTGLVTYGLFKGVQAAHQKATDDGGSTGAPDDRESLVIESLKRKDREGEARLLEQMLEDREAIRVRCERHGNEPDFRHTLDLVSAITEESCRQGEELLDLIRRIDDPILKSPSDGEARVEVIQKEFEAAYQAVADARSRLRRGESLKEVDFLQSDLNQGGLAVLTAQLNEETAISRKIDERLHPEIEDRIVKDDTSGTGRSSDDTLESN